jgi:glycosyltransferase involved in cell wall biosynthesis
MKVTIIIPVYNGAKYIEETIQSCLSQSYCDLEVIAIDDSSKDNSYEILNKYKSRGVKVLNNDHNQGLAKTINLGVSESKGEVILILGQDDILHQGHISRKIEMFLNNVVFVHSASNVIDKDGASTHRVNCPGRRLPFKNKLFSFYISSYNCVSSCGLLFRKDAFERVGGWDESYKNYGEWLLWIKLSREGDVRFDSTITSDYRIHESNISHSFSTMKVKLDLKKYKDDTRTYVNNNFGFRVKFFVMFFCLIQSLYLKFRNDSFR